MNPPFTLYLADDHQIIIDGLKLLIGSEESIRIIGYANDGATACQDILMRKPDLALIDYSMPKMNGLDLIRTLRKQVETRFVMLSMYDSPRQIKDARDNNASGYILKNAGKQELMKCLATVMKGGTYFPDLQQIKQDLPKSIFTPREIEILRFMLDGVKTADIAEELALSPLTVETHRKNICRKTETNNVHALNKFLQEHKIEI